MHVSRVKPIDIPSEVDSEGNRMDVVVHLLILMGTLFGRMTHMIRKLLDVYKQIKFVDI